MKKASLLIPIILAAVYFGFIQTDWLLEQTPVEHTRQSDDILARAFKQRQGNVQVQGQGTVVKLLPDDLKGSRHQRFLIQLASGQTLLIAHNIDLAPRIEALQIGDTVYFYGEYEWNSKGGVIHWTHHDPKSRHVNGWLKHKGNTYQ